MNMQPLSIRTILIFTICSLTLLIGFLAARETYIEGNRLIRMRSLHEATLTSDKLFEISAELSELRDVTYFMIYADQDMINTLKPHLIESRKIVDNSIEETFISLNSYNFPEMSIEIDATKTSFDELKRLRLQIDHEMTLPAAKRNHKTLELWYQQITGVILQIHAVWLQLIKHYREIDSTVALHLRFKHLLAIVMEYTGRERALIGRMIVESRAPTPEEQANLLKWHGAAEMGWERIISLAEQGNLSATLGPYIKDTLSHSTSVYEMVRDMFYVPGVKYNKTYPIGIELWLEISTQVLDSSKELKDAVLKETSQYVEILEHQARIAIVINIVIVLFSIWLCLYSFWIISFRVLRPIDNMVKALIDATLGNHVSISTIDKNRQDEIGKLARVLHLYQKNADEVKRTSEKLKRYTVALERSNKELDDFAYIASHDLKEPLRGIHNHSRFLLEDNEAKLEKESVDRLGRLVYLSQRMERLVNDLLYFSRLGRQDLAIGPADINEVIHDIESTLDVFMAEHNARILIPKKMPTITCDKTRIAEVFRNLITNAIKYNDKTVKTVEIGFMETYTANNGVEIRDVFYVKDDGNGIPEEFYTEIFRIFKRLQTPKNKEEQGTGVGLTFVKKIIERHGGRIWLESKLNQGTIFYFTLEGI